MLHLSSHCSYYLFNSYINMHSSFDSLSGLVLRHMGMKATNGSVFIFMNRNRNQIKLLYWEGDGFALYYKRLEKGTYELPIFSDAGTSVSISAEQLQLILQGIKLKSVVKRSWYSNSIKNSAINRTNISPVI